MVVPSKEEVASTVVPSQVEGFAVALVASLLVSLVVDSRVCNRVCHHMNASALENAFSDCVIHVHGGGGAFGILPPRDMPLPLRPAPCLSYSAGVCE
jgi:hypothetical protein